MQGNDPPTNNICREICTFSTISDICLEIMLSHYLILPLLKTYIMVGKLCPKCNKMMMTGSSELFHSRLTVSVCNEFTKVQWICPVPAHKQLTNTNNSDSDRNNNGDRYTLLVTLIKSQYLQTHISHDGVSTAQDIHHLF